MPHREQANCNFREQSFHEGKRVFGAVGNSYDGAPSDDEGLIGGDAHALAPTVLFHWNKPTYLSTWATGARWLARVSPAFEVFAYDWNDLDTEIPVASPITQPWDGQVIQLQVHGDAIFWLAGDSHQYGINVWDPVHGTRPFQRWPGDYTKGAGDFGTDGVDMVWGYGDGKEPNDVDFANASIMTAKFTTDPAKLAPKRLRSFPFPHIASYAIKVGCGRAALRSLDETAPTSTVVRLSDGWSWTIPHTASFEHYDVLGLTCDEVFLIGRIDGRSNIARIRLDSLGPGVAPD